MRIEIEPARTDGHDAPGPGPGVDAGPDRPGAWSDAELARLRSEWDAEPGHR